MILEKSHLNNKTLILDLLCTSHFNTVCGGRGLTCFVGQSDWIEMGKVLGEDIC